MKDKNILLLEICWIIFQCSILHADLVYFKGGGSAQVPILRKGADIFIRGPGGEVAFDQGAISRIVPFNEPAVEWPARRDAVGSAGIGARIDLAMWAIENGLTTEGIATLRAVRASSSQDGRLATLIRTLDSISPALGDPEPGGLDESIRGFQVERSAHFLLHHQLERTEAAARLDLLERVYFTFYLTFAARGLELPPPRARLVSILYSRERDYTAFIVRESAAAFKTTQGFYHPSRNVVVAFDPKDLPSIRTHIQALERRKVELGHWQETARRMAPSSKARIDPDGVGPKFLRKDEAERWVSERRGDFDRQFLLLDLQCRSIDLGLAAHETVHQLIANSGLAPSHDAFPTWLHEGIAMQFEVVRGGSWAGVGHAHDLRLPDWRSIRPAPRLAPLVRDEGLGAGYRRDPYAASWALVYFLRKQHPDQFATLIDLLRLPGRDKTDRPAYFVATVRKAIGADFGPTEAEWHRFMRSVVTPLESSKEPVSTSPRLPSGHD